MIEQYEAIKSGEANIRMLITIDNNRVVDVSSPTHYCFSADFLGDDWVNTRKMLEAQGFLIHHGN